MPAKLGRRMFGRWSVTMVSCGDFHTMVVMEAGRLFTLGYGVHCQLGHCNRNSQDVPMEVGAARFRGARIVYAAAGYFHSGVVTLEGRVWTWGHAEFGRLGHNDEHFRLVLKEVEGELGGGKAVMLAAGYAHTMVVTHDVGLRPWTPRPAGCGQQGKQADSGTGGDGGGLRAVGGADGRVRQFSHDSCD